MHEKHDIRAHKGIKTCRLRQHGIRDYRPFRGMTLTRHHQLRRLRWTRQYQRWRHRNWQRVLFSDESRFQFFRADGRTRIYRCARERTALCCVQETVPFGGGSVMVWGGILWPTADRPYCHRRKSYRTPFLTHGGHTRY